MTGSLRTTNSWASAQDFASLIRANYIYEARASGFDVNAIFGARSPFPWENEISVPNLISPSDIRGHGCRADGFLTRGRALTREQVALPAVRAGKPTDARVAFAAGDMRVVEAAIGDDLDGRGEGPDLFQALADVRRVLVASSVLIAWNGSRMDVFPSPMLRQAADGRYLRSGPESAELVSVDDQRAWFDRWRDSGIGERVSL